MTRLLTHFLDRASGLVDCASVEVDQNPGGGVFVRLHPHNSRSAGVVLYLSSTESDVGTVCLDDQASVPAELGEDEEVDQRAIDACIEVAVEGWATAYHRRRGGGCVEERDTSGRATRSYMEALPLPGWRRRWTRVEYEPYR